MADTSQTTGQSTGAAERSAHVIRGADARPAGTSPFVGPELGPLRLRAVADLEAEVARLRAALVAIADYERRNGLPEWGHRRAGEMAREALAHA